MATRRQVICINKRDQQSAHERIMSIGGTGWKVSQEVAIQQIESGTHSCYVISGSEVEVIVATHSGNKYIKTKADGLQSDNLLSLPECP